MHVRRVGHGLVVADATGFPLDESRVEPSAEVRHALDLGRFASAVNTSGAR